MQSVFIIRNLSACLCSLPNFSAVSVLKEQVGASTTVTFGDGEAVYAKASDKGLRFVLIGGEPIGEPVAQVCRS